MSPAAPRPDGGRNLTDRVRTSADTDPVKIFQRAHGLVVDGIAGPKTLAAGYKPPNFSPSGAIAGGTTGLLEQGQLGKFLNAIAQVESGGSYSSVGPSVGGDRAYGKYQIMGNNIPQWSREVLGHSVTIAQYMGSPQLQEQVAQGKLSQYFHSYGAAGAASAWFTGSPTSYLRNPGVSDGNMTASKYVNAVLSGMGQASSTVSNSSGVAGGGLAWGGPGGGGHGGGLAKTILDYASTFLGTPYKWGGAAPGGFDCSGLIQYVYGKNGIHLPRVADQQENAGARLSQADARPGDLVSLDENARDANGLGADHIGIYLGNGKMLVSPHTGSNVQIQDIGNFGFAPRFTRVLPDHPSTFAGFGKGADGMPSFSVGAAGGVRTDPNAAASVPWDPKKFQQELAGAGFAAGLINSDKSLKDLFAKAVQTKMDSTEFLTALENTSWFTHRSASQRAYDELTFSDHAQFKAQLGSKVAEVKALAAQLGVPMSAARLDLLGHTALRNSFSPDEMKAAIGAELHYNPRIAYGGTLGQTVNQLKQAASDYYVTLDDKTLGQFATQVTSGASTADHWTNFLKAQAASKFPWLKDQIDQGFTIAQLANPYKQEMAKTLEIDPGAINNADTTVLKGLQYQDPANMKGGFTTMPLYKFSDSLRQDPRWLHTDNARNSAMDTASGVLRDMGLVS